MENYMEAVKIAVIRKLKEIDQDVDVFTEEIKRTAQEQDGLPGTYYFLDMIPNATETVSKTYTDVSILIDISYHDSSEKNAVYLKKQMQLDKAIRPVLQIEDRHITIQRANQRVVDKVLHYSFFIDFRIAEAEEQGETAAELAISVKGA